MEWLAVAVFGIMWAAILLPSPRRRPSPRTSVEDFGRDMDLLAHAEGGTHGRWIVTPRKGVPFLGMPRRERVRARERRRHVFVFLLESILITFLMGLVPPLRVMWVATAALGGLLLAYVWLLLWIKARGSEPHPHEAARAARAPEPSVGAVDRTTPAPRYAAEGGSRTARPIYAGMGGFDDEDSVHVVVLPASQRLSVAGA